LIFKYYNIMEIREEPVPFSVDDKVPEALSTKEPTQVVLYRAIQQNDAEKALQILANNEEEMLCQFLDPSNVSRWSMLHWASYYGNEKVVDALLNCNAASNYKLYQMKSRMGKTNQHHVQQVGKGDNVRHYQQHQQRILNSMLAKLEHRSSSGIWPMDPVVIGTPLHRAAQQGHIQVSWLLLLSSYSVHDVDNLGNTPLHLCSAAGHGKLLRFFLNDGADIYAKNRFHNTPNDVAKT